MGFVTTDMMRKLLHLPDVEYDRESIGRGNGRNRFLRRCRSFGNINGRHATSIALPNCLSCRVKPRKTIAMKRSIKIHAFTIIHAIQHLVTASCGATLAGVREFAEGRWNHQTSLFTPFMPMN